MDDRVGLAQDLEPLLGDLADDADGEAGAGKGWRQTISSGRPSATPDRADLVLEQVAQRLDELELHVSGRPPTLWCVLILAATPSLAAADSITSG